LEPGADLKLEAAGVQSGWLRLGCTGHESDGQAQRIPVHVSTSAAAAAAAVTACRAHRAGAGAMLPHPHRC